MMKSVRNRIHIQNIDFSKIVDHGKDPSFYKKIALKILDYIESNNSTSLQEILAYVGGGERRVVRLLDQMVNLGILEFKSSKFYIPHIKDSYPFTISDARCSQCDSKVVNINGKIKTLLNFINRVQQDRPKPTFIFDQRPVNTETVVRRVAYTIWRNDLQNKKIAVIGDDDLLSIALAYTRMAREIVVFDIDERILSLIHDISMSYNLSIQVVKQDLVKDIPSSYLRYFDTFITDPTPNIKPLTLFTIKGLEMLAKEPAKAGYISLYPSHADLIVDFQKILSKMNILITDIIPFFNQYEIIGHTLSESDLKLLKKYDPHKKSISFYEYLMRVETTTQSKTLSVKFSPDDLIGKATKQILEDPMKDPVLSQTSKPEFIDSYARNLKKLLNKKTKT